MFKRCLLFVENYLYYDAIHDYLVWMKTALNPAETIGFEAILEIIFFTFFGGGGGGGAAVFLRIKSRLSSIILIPPPFAPLLK